MGSFAFQPELFEHRSCALEALAARGFHWLEHFSSVDLLHDVFGLEVCAIVRQADADAIRLVLVHLFPAWTHSAVFYRSDGADRGWKTLIHREAGVRVSPSLA